MLTTKASNVTQKILTSTDVVQGDFSWKTENPGMKLITGKWAPGQNQPTFTFTKSGTYYIAGQVNGQIGYHQVQLQYFDTSGNLQGILAAAGDHSPAQRGVMVPVSALVHMYAGQKVAVYVHTDTAGLELEADLWIKNLFVD